MSKTPAHAAENDCPCGRGPGHVRIKAAGCTPSGEKDVTHWGSVDYRPTSLHGNGAASFTRTTLDPARVTCRLCVTLLAKSESLSWVDRQGDVWRVGEDGLMHTPETAPFPREHVEKKWGPLRLTAVIPPAADQGASDV